MQRSRIPLWNALKVAIAGSALPEIERGPQVPPGATNLCDYPYELRRVEEGASRTACWIDSTDGSVSTRAMLGAVRPHPLSARITISLIAARGYPRRRHEDISGLCGPVWRKMSPCGGYRRCER